MTEPLYEHGNFADLIGYRLTAWRQAMTLSLNTQYIGPVPAGTRLTASARRSGGGSRIFFSTCEVRDQDRRLVATGAATYRYRGDA